MLTEVLKEGLTSLIARFCLKIQHVRNSIFGAANWSGFGDFQINFWQSVPKRAVPQQQSFVPTLSQIAEQLRQVTPSISRNTEKITI